MQGGSHRPDPTGGDSVGVLKDATGGLGGPAAGTTSIGGHVPVRTDDAVGASDQVRANARSVAPISATTRAEARELIARYPRPRSALLPMLHLVQSEHGYVTPEGVAMCAEELGLTKAEVGAVATFYTMYKRRPTGEYLVSVCTNTLCGFLGGEEIYAALSDHLGVGHDQTTPDGQITLEHAECLAACDYAPVVTVNYEFYDQQDTESSLSLVRDLQRGERPHPTRGAPLRSFREISREVAGFVDSATVSDAVNGPSAGEPTVAGNREALSRGHESPAFDADTPIAAAPSKPQPSETPPAAREPAPQTSASGPVAGQSPSPPAAPPTGQQPADAEPRAEAAQPADTEPRADADGGQSPEKALSEQAEQRAHSRAEAAGAQAADPDAEEAGREPGGTPSARRTRRRSGGSRESAAGADGDTRTRPTDGKA